VSFCHIQEYQAECHNAECIYAECHVAVEIKVFALFYISGVTNQESDQVPISQNLFPLSLTISSDKLECLSLAIIFSLVQYMPVLFSSLARDNIR
jgi:hypothetical protein